MAAARSIKAQIRVLVLAIALPLVLLASYTVFADFRGGLRIAQQEAGSLATSTAVAAGEYLVAADRLASRLTVSPEVRSLDPDRCMAALTPIVDALPQVANMVLVDGDADPVCTVVAPVTGQVQSAADRPWVQEALAGRRGISPPVEGRIIQRDVVIVVYPVRGESGDVIGGLTVPLDLDGFQAVLDRPLPEGALVTLTDTASTVLARSADPEAWVGRRLPQPAEAEEFADLTQPFGFNTTVSADGERTLFAFRRVEDSPWVAWVGLPVDHIYAPARRALYPKIAMVLAGLLFAAVLGHRFSGRVQASLDGLSDEMKAAEADPQRVVNEEGPDEVARVARQFNHLLLDRRRASSQAALSADLHQLVLRATQDAVWDWDLENETLEGNRRFYELFGSEGPEAGRVEEFWRRRIHPDDVEGALRIKYERPREGIAIWSHEYRIRSDQGWAIVLDRGRVLRDESGRAVRLIGSIMDVTEERQSQRAVHRAKERYESIVRNATFGVYVAAPDGTVLETNPALEQMLGFEGAEGKSEDDVRNERTFFKDPEEWEQQIEEAMGGASPQAKEVDWIRSDGSQMQVRLFRSVFRDSDGSAATEVIAEDLTERRQLELQFRQAQKMEAMGRLAGGVAHDFNNRLTVIRGQAQLLRDDLGDDPVRLRSLDAIIASSDRAAQLTRELLAVSRKQIFRPRVLSLNDVVTRMRPMFDTLLGKATSVESELDRTVPPVEADPGQVEQILMNLVVNARDAVADGGSITIRTALRDVDATESETHPGLEPGRYVSLSVRDTGVGMSTAVLERVFEPFFTTKPQGQGTGLGLATVYGLVKLNGGWIGLTSEPGMGTHAEVLLPPASELSAPAAEPEVEPLPPDGSGAKILVVEDEEGVRAIVKRTLERLQYEVVTEESADAALERTHADLSSFDLVVTDIVMPGRSGLELAEHLHEEVPDLPILFMSGYTERSAALVADLGPTRQFIPKPFTPNSLGGKVAEMLQENG